MVLVTVTMDTLLARWRALTARRAALRSRGVAILIPKHSSLKGNSMVIDDASAPAPTHLFEFRVGPDVYRCALADHGAYGIEAQLFMNDRFWVGRTFPPTADADGARNQAIKWAYAEKASIERLR